MDKRKARLKALAPIQKEINKAIGVNLKSARLNRVVCQYNIDPNGNKNVYYVKKFCNQTEMAKAINVTFQQIQKYEKGTNGLSAYRLLQISRFLNKPVEEFLDISLNDSGAIQNQDSIKLVGQSKPSINSSVEELISA